MSDFTDYAHWRFRADGNGTHGSIAPVTQETRERAIEPGRLARAVERPIKKLGPRQYAVKGNVERMYYVDLNQSPACTCRDREYRTVQCLHELAAKLQERDPAVMAALVDAYITRGRILKEAGLTEDSDDERC